MTNDLRIAPERRVLQRFGLPIALVVGLSVLGLTGAMAWVARARLTGHDRFALALQRGLELDARLAREVAQARLGLVNHFDGLVRIERDLVGLERELGAPPRFPPAWRERLLALHAARARARLVRSEDVERFKMEFAVLRNSWRSISRLGDKLEAALEPAGSHELQLAVDHVMRRIVPAPGGPATSDVLAGGCALARLLPAGSEEGRGCPPLPALDAPGPAMRDDLQTFSRHAQVILSREPVVDVLVQRLMDDGPSELLRRMLRTYDVAHADAMAGASAWRAGFALATFSLILLVAAAMILHERSSRMRITSTATMLEHTLEELEEERDRQAELAELKSRFVSMTSHEFRTPLSVMLSSTELLEAYGECWDRDRRQVHLSRILEAGRAMSTMLDGVLLIGKAEAGMLDFSPTSVSLDSLLDAVVDEVRATDFAGRRLDDDRPPEPTTAHVDDRLLRHILINLLSNAFKYSDPESTVHLKVRMHPEELRIEVRDEGIGIPEGDLPRLFEAFHRCANADAIPGTGLGLAIVKHAAEVHGGRIEVDSELGVGTLFTVSIPLDEESP